MCIFDANINDNRILLFSFSRKSELAIAHSSNFARLTQAQIEMLHHHLHVAVERLVVLDLVIMSQKFIINHVCDYKSLLISHEEAEIIGLR